MRFVPRPVQYRMIRRLTRPELLSIDLSDNVHGVPGDCLLEEVGTGRRVLVRGPELLRLYAPVDRPTADAMAAVAVALARSPASRYSFAIVPADHLRVPPKPALSSSECPPERAGDQPVDGLCARTACRKPRAVCRHRHDGRMYCVRCARRINDANRMHDGGRPLVEIPAISLTDEDLGTASSPTVRRVRPYKPADPHRWQDVVAAADDAVDADHQAWVERINAELGTPTAALTPPPPFNVAGSAEDTTPLTADERAALGLPEWLPAEYPHSALEGIEQATAADLEDDGPRLTIDRSTSQLPDAELGREWKRAA